MHPKKYSSRSSAARAAATAALTVAATSSTPIPLTKPSYNPSSLLLRGGTSASDYYTTLRIPRTATPTEIQKAYRRRAVETHPDKTSHGDRKEFDAVSEAFDVLSDPEKRARYDRFGKAGVDRTSFGAGGLAEELFHSFFEGGSMFHRRRPAAPPRRDVRYQMQVTLEDLYAGATKHIILNNPSNHRTKKIPVEIHPGMVSGQKIRLVGELETSRDAPPSDVILILHTLPHSTFERKNCDLAMECEVSLSESLCGFIRSVKFLDGEALHFGYFPTEENSMMISNNQVFKVKGRGMPIPSKRRQEMQYGDLYIRFRVRMPQPNKLYKSYNKILTLEERRQLAKLLDKLEGVHPHETKEGDKSKIEECPLQPASLSEFGRLRGFYEDEEEDHHLHSDGEEEESHPFFERFRGFYPEQDERHVQCQQM